MRPFSVQNTKEENIGSPRTYCTVHRLLSSKSACSKCCCHTVQTQCKRSGLVGELRTEPLQHAHWRARSTLTHKYSKSQNLVPVLDVLCSFYDALKYLASPHCPNTCTLISNPKLPVGVKVNMNDCLSYVSAL